MKLAPAIALSFIVAAPAAAQTDAAAAPPTRAEIAAKLQSRYAAMDSNGDGTLDKAEVQAANATVAAQAAAAVGSRLEKEFAELDTSKDGMLSLAEFKAGVPVPKPTPVETTLQQLDSDKNEKVSFEEFSASYLAAFDKLDANKDGTVTRSEQQTANR